MAKIYFNDRAVKTEKETTILNWFAQDDGVTIFLRDTRVDTYNGAEYVYGDIDTYQLNGDYYVDIVPQKKLDGTVMGVFISEGTDFEIVTTEGKAPLFVVRQDATKMALGMLPSMNKGLLVKEVTMGMFHVGSVLSFKRDGVPIEEALTPTGWVRRGSAPNNLELGIKNTHEAYQAKLQKEDESEEDVAKKIAELREHSKRPEVNSTVIDALIASKLEDRDNSVHIFLMADLAKLRKQGVI